MKLMMIIMMKNSRVKKKKKMMIKKLSLGESQPRSLEIIATKSENKDKLETDDDKMKVEQLHE